jgi:hypothetical protein
LATVRFVIRKIEKRNYAGILSSSNRKKVKKSYAGVYFSGANRKYCTRSPIVYIDTCAVYF